jgi:hypothetical protein
MAKTLKGRELVNIVAINDDSSDAPIMFHFDTEATRAEFLKHVDPRYGEFTIIDQMTARDAKVLRAAVEMVEPCDIAAAIESGDAQNYFEEDETFRFYDCGDELQDIYDADLESGERVRGTGRTC